ncbi:SBBP repeat-containing protein [Granulicella sibirica]|uniref:DUF7948 domain-containing protein n=1 Tax=Granulicella sibirica TaxID=2479048 RepID=UPI001008C06E|nr:SBBP repeat-containing protein [Granulicella sibirica]
MPSTLALTSVLMSPVLAVAADDPAVTTATRQRLIQVYGDLAMSFTANQGQADPRFAFTAEGSGYSVQLGRKGGELTFAGASNTEARGEHADGKTALQLSFPGANETSTISGLERLPGDSNYLVGSNPSQWHTSVPNYARVKYAGLYRGVDLVYYGNHRQLEFDFVVAPHVDVTTVRMEFKNLTDGEGPQGKGKQLSVNKQGDLVLGGETDTVLLHKPNLYQTAMVDGKEIREAVEGEFVVEGGEDVRFHAGPYDHARELVIDPTLIYSTYFGGNGQFDSPRVTGLAIDPSGDAYILGFTTAANFPITPGALKSTNGTGIFISKINRAGSALLYSTYFGTQFGGSLASLAVNSKGEAYVAGIASDFPTTSRAYQRTAVGEAAYIAKLNATGSGLIYGTYLGGSSPDGFSQAFQIVVDAQDNAYVLGLTGSFDFPTTAGAYEPHPPLTGPIGSPQQYLEVCFLTKLNPAGSGLVYSTFLGANNVIAQGLALDSLDNAYIYGSNLGAGRIQFPISPGAFSNTGDLYLEKLNSSGSKLVYYTLLGNYIPSGLAVDPFGNAYLAGIDTVKGAPQNVFVIKMNTTGTALDYVTLLGKTSGDKFAQLSQASTSMSIAVDAAGNAYVTGGTNDPQFPVTPDAAQTVFVAAPPAYSQDVFLTKLDPSGANLTYSTFLGAVGDSLADFVAIDGKGDVAIAGTVRGNYPLTSDPIQAAHNPNLALFVSEFNLGEPFCSFLSKVQLESAADKTPGFALESTFAVGTSTPIQAETRPLNLTIGATTMTIPAGGLVKNALGYSFSGTVNGVRLLLFLASAAPQPGAQTTCGTPAYKLTAVGSGGFFGSSASPIGVAVALGDDSGSAEVKATGLN